MKNSLNDKICFIKRAPFILNPDAQLGITLIEGLVALFLFSVTFLGLSKLLQQSHFFTKQAEQQLKHSRELQNQFEDAF